MPSSFLGQTSGPLRALHLIAVALFALANAGPSDGIVFVASCGGSAIVEVNHLGLGRDIPAVSRIKA